MTHFLLKYSKAKLNSFSTYLKMSTSNEIVGIGSCICDFVGYGPKLPTKGETIQGARFGQNFGGKASNQCATAAKLGGNATLVARVGDDTWGEQYIESLIKCNVNTEYVLKTKDCSSGFGIVHVSDEGYNQIMTIPGANDRLSTEDVQNAKDIISSAKIVLVELITPADVAILAMEIATNTTILNASPATTSYDPKLLTLPSIFCVNESEASVFSSLPLNNLDEAKKAAKHLVQKGCNIVVVTLGEGGAIFVNKENRNEVVHVKCPKVNAIDSTGAGDCFTGALAFFLANYSNLTMTEIVKKACFVASDSVTKFGTQNSFPGKEILKKMGFTDKCSCKK